MKLDGQQNEIPNLEKRINETEGELEIVMRNIVNATDDIRSAEGECFRADDAKKTFWSEKLTSLRDDKTALEDRENELRFDRYIFFFDIY